MTKRTLIPSLLSRREANRAGRLVQDSRFQRVQRAVRPPVVFFSAGLREEEEEEDVGSSLSGEKKNGVCFGDSVTHCGFGFLERSLAGSPSAPPPRGNDQKSERSSSSLSSLSFFFSCIQTQCRHFLLMSPLSCTSQMWRNELKSLRN